ncbi:nitroreductase family protein [Crenobacter sp. SG2305]|uniref:nitroreductase family protein n=1 Tax=Crenobacter oryzisoli TaxID=3056844 RepID=UPI0025AA90B8|nr:nitroreductase family protein [Crenobacter sp. SG2305]MDN0085774.1 nitroreductase family protein [Crenobacter sp. SG2305]
MTSERQEKLLEVIKGRRSVRSYTAEDIDKATIMRLLDAAIHAPNALNEQVWSFAVVQDRAWLKQLSDKAKPLFYAEASQKHLDRGDSHALDIFTNPDFNVFYNAGTLILICSDKQGPFVHADCWLAAENLMLAAYVLGLGSCIIGSALEALNLPESKADIGLTKEMTVVVPIILGIPSGETAASSRRNVEVSAWRSS